MIASVSRDNLATRIDQQTAGIPGVQCRIGLDNIIDERPEPARIERPSALHHAGSHGLVKSEGAAEWHRDLADRIAL